MFAKNVFFQIKAVFQVFAIFVRRNVGSDNNYGLNKTSLALSLFN